MNIRVITESISKQELQDIAKDQFGEFMKAVVDVEKKVMAIGGELHADEEVILLESGSKQEDLWGINLRFDRPSEEWVEFSSMINIRPSQGNRSRNVEDKEIQQKILEVVEKRVQK